MRDDLGKLRKKGVKKLGPKAIFNRINASGLHESIYKHLCQSSHAAMTPLFYEYADLSSGSKTRKYVKYPRITADGLFPHLHATGFCLLFASIKIHEFSKTNLEGDFK
ncbi:MAG: hypothetical protein ACD_11C00040G0001, partial [uncultured bacterium]